MVNLKTLEKLRTKEELINYFKQLGKEITEEELYALKQSYEQAQESNGALTLEQLDDVAGGLIGTITGYCIGRIFRRSEYKKMNELCDNIENGKVKYPKITLMIALQKFNPGLSYKVIDDEEKYKDHVNGGVEEGRRLLEGEICVTQEGALILLRKSVEDYVEDAPFYGLICGLLFDMGASMIGIGIASLFADGKSNPDANKIET